jgi:hypothetical protein
VVIFCLQAFKGMEAARSQPKSVASAKHAYDRLVVLKEHLLEKLQPKDSDGKARESTVRGCYGLSSLALRSTLS